MESDEAPRPPALDVRTWSRRRRFGLLALLGVLVAGGPLGTDMYTPALPQVIDDLGTETSLVQLTLMAYNLGLGGGQFAWGPISDRIGRRVPVILGASCFALAALLCSLAPNIGVLLAARVLMGFAGAAGIVVGRAIARDLYSGAADVIVCDGFTGNVALKVSEGLVEAAEELLGEELSRTFTVRVGSLLTRRALRHFRRRVDYSEYGGAPLLGVAGVVIVGHGRSSPKAVRNAVAMAYRFAAGPFIERVQHDLRVASARLHETRVQ